MNIDIESIMGEATGGNRVVPDEWMPSSRVRSFILSDPGVIWLEFHGKEHDLKPDLPSPYSFFEFRQTLILMDANTPIIVQPALWWEPEKVYGVPDLLVHTSWLEKKFPSLMDDLKNKLNPGEEPDGYVIFEIRLGSEKEIEQEAVETQVRLNNYLLGQIQGWVPPQSFLITRREVSRPKVIEIQSHLDHPLDPDLLDIRNRFLEIKDRGKDLLP
jgi:hypothetical protein